MNDLYRDIIYNLARRAIADATSISALLHTGIKGQLRELFVRQLLEPMLPPGYITGSGNIITAYNQVSSQLDVVVCDRRIVPPLLFQGDVGIFPVEAALCVIEVKSVLTAEELRKAHASALRNNQFKHCVGNGPDIEHLVQCVFAFGTDLSPGGRSEIDRYIEINAGEDAIRAICVVGRGYWFKYNDQWINGTMPGIGGEIVAFLASIANRIQLIASTRRPPDLFEYLHVVHSGDPSSLTLGAD